LGFDVNTFGQYTIKATEISNFASGINIYLEDRKLGVIQNLTVKPKYSFAYQSTDHSPQSTDHSPQTTDHRFYLRFGVESSENGDKSEIFYAYSDKSDLYVNFYDEEEGSGVLTIYDIEGKLLFAPKEIGNGMYKYKLDYATGIYFVKFVSNNKVYNRKVFMSKE
jgi:hypothetical protein